MTPAAMTHPHILRLLRRRRASRALRRPAPLAALVALLLATACTYSGDIDDPFVRRLQWFSYVKGEDIEASCAEGTPENYRLVYNADFLEQVRSYEVMADGSGGALLVARAAPGGASLSNIYLDDLHGSWRWYKSETRLDAASFDELRARLAEDGYLEHRDGLVRLNSRDFYWAVTGCVDGRFEAGAWLNGPQNIVALHFPEFLYGRDETGLPVAAPRWVAAGDRYGRSGHAGEDVTIGPFWITIDDRARDE
jgi:hypothetical protein